MRAERAYYKKGGVYYDTYGFVSPRWSKLIYTGGGYSYLRLWRYTHVSAEYNSKIVVELSYVASLFTSEDRKWGSTVLGATLFRVYDGTTKLELQRSVREPQQKKEGYPDVFESEPFGALVL
ncbi:MAG: hypothetical protein ACPL3C_07980 [Pyrobaculum sp.]